MGALFSLVCLSLKQSAPQTGKREQAEKEAAGAAPSPTARRRWRWWWWRRRTGHANVDRSAIIARIRIIVVGRNVDRC
jgi:hypothetical protein